LDETLRSLKSPSKEFIFRIFFTPWRAKSLFSLTAHILKVHIFFIF